MDGHHHTVSSARVILPATRREESVPGTITNRRKFVCEFGWGGAFCDKQLCPIVPGEGMCGGKYRGKCVANSSVVDKNATWTPASCVCKAGLGGVDCMKAGGCGGSGHDCGSSGRCVAGSCVCNPGWGGVL